MFFRTIVNSLADQIPELPDNLEQLLEYPPNADIGDVALPCFHLARTMRQNPQQIAQQLAKQISHPAFQAEAAGPYLNFRLNRPQFAMELLQTADTDDFWKPELGRGERIVIDMSSPNIAKPFGIGHLRSTMIGNALYRILREVGYETISVNHLGDWGTQFGKMIVAYLKWHDTLNAASIDNPTKAYLELYVKFHEEAKKHPELETEAREWFKRLENDDETARALWHKMIQDSTVEFNKLYARLGVAFDYTLGESFYNDKMDAVVAQLAELKLLEESDGAQVVRLDEYGMPPCIIVKSNGTSIYATRDLATALYRYNEQKADQLFYVVGGEQTLHFRQVFLVLKKMGCDWADQCQHISFGLMMMEGTKMSTRRGKVLFLEEVLDEAVEQALQFIAVKNPALPDKQAVAEAIGVGAVVFGDLKNTRTLNVDFTLQEVLQFDGETGPYLQYTYARTASILRKADAVQQAVASGKLSLQAADFSIASQQQTWDMIITLSKYTEQLHLAAERREPSVIARYLLDLAQAFNRFYHHTKVLAGDDTEQAAKLALVNMTGKVLRRGLHLLGLQTPEEI